VKVGWVRGQNHLYFLYEAQDNYWDFARDDLHNDIFEVVIDGDRSGGPLIARCIRRGAAREARGLLSLSRRPRAELSHFHAGRRERLGHGLGRAALDQGVALCQRGLSVQLSAWRKRKLVLEFFVTSNSPYVYPPRG